MQEMFSQSITMEQIFEHEYFKLDVFDAPRSKVQVHYQVPKQTVNDESDMVQSKSFISDKSINLANLKHILKKQKEQVRLFLSKDSDGKNGISLLDESMMILIESNQSSFKVIQLPKFEQLNLEAQTS